MHHIRGPNVRAGFKLAPVNGPPMRMQKVRVKPTATPSKGQKGKKERRQPRRYTVRSGDTPSSIADKTGIPLEQILRLNPDLDPQTLSPGERIRLRQ